MRHNEDVVSAWGVFVMSHIGYRRKVSSAIYVEAPLNQVDAFYNWVATKKVM